MKITKSEGYHGRDDCPILEDCRRRYCDEHRLLYNECETAIKGWEGDREVFGGARQIWESDGECPYCKKREKDKKLRQQVERMYPGLILCPECLIFQSKNPDDVAIHLIDTHGLNTDDAALWLRREVEAKAFMGEQ